MPVLGAPLVQGRGDSHREQQQQEDQGVMVQGRAGLTQRLRRLQPQAAQASGRRQRRLSPSPCCCRVAVLAAEHPFLRSAAVTAGPAPPSGVLPPSLSLVQCAAAPYLPQPLTSCLCVHQRFTTPSPSTERRAASGQRRRRRRNTLHPASPSKSPETVCAENVRG